MIAEEGRDPPPVILITRPEVQGRALARRMGLKGWAPVLCPLTSLVALRATPEIDGVRGLVFTSANGVRSANLPDAARALPAWCVGPATAAAATEAGFQAIEGPSTAHALAKKIIAEGPAGMYLHIRGRHGTNHLRQELTNAGFGLRDSEVYEMRPVERAAPEAREAILAGELRAATFYSPRAALLFADLIAASPDLRAGLHRASAAAISPETARNLRDLGFAEVLCADSPDGDGMDAAIAQLKTAPRRL
jgi:uroporphyrinogen-III synthase